MTPEDWAKQRSVLMRNAAILIGQAPKNFETAYKNKKLKRQDIQALKKAEEAMKRIFQKLDVK